MIIHNVLVSTVAICKRSSSLHWCSWPPPCPQPALLAWPQGCPCAPWPARQGLLTCCYRYAEFAGHHACNCTPKLIECIQDLPIAAISSIAINAGHSSPPLLQMLALCW